MVDNSHKWPCHGCGKIINADVDDYLLIGEYYLYVGDDAPDSGDDPPVLCYPACVTTWIKWLWVVEPLSNP